MIVLALSHPISININEEVKILGNALKYKSHIEEALGPRNQTHFSFDGRIYCQDQNQTLVVKEFGVFANVKILSLAVWRCRV